MAIGNKYVNNALVIPVNIKAPTGQDDDGRYTFGDETGVIFNMTSSKATKALVEAKKMRNDLLSKRKGKSKSELSGDDIDAIEDMLVRKLAACIDSWEWPEEYFEGEGKPKLSIDEAVRILKDADWILVQISEVSDNVENFIVK